MEAAIEQDGNRQVLHSCVLPGLAVSGEAGVSQALALREEAVRFARCFPWLKFPVPRVLLVTERLNSPFLPEWESGAALLTADMERTAQELEQQCRLLCESAVLLQQCLDSFPDAAYDCGAGEESPDWLPRSGQQVLQRYTDQLQKALAVWGLSLPEDGWTDSLQAALEKLCRRQDFMQNQLFWTPDGFCCAGYWLRVQTERCHLSGRRLYELGVSSFGSRCIADTMHFYG